MTQRQPPQRNRQRTGQLSGVQIMFAMILAIGLILAINFSSRISAGQPLQEAHSGVAAEIEQLQQEQATLIARRDHVRSDVYVEQWARDEGKLVRPGEVLVIPVPSGSVVEPTPAPTPNIPIETSPPEPETWLVWWSLFFDGEPPQF